MLLLVNMPMSAFRLTSRKRDGTVKLDQSDVQVGIAVGSVQIPGAPQVVAPGAAKTPQELAEIEAWVLLNYN